MTHVASPDLGGVGACQGFWPGHQVHWIPALKAAKKRDPCSSAVVQSISWSVSIVPNLEVEGHVIAIQTSGEVRRYWNHDPDRIARALEIFGPDVQLQDGWGLFGIPNGKSTYLFSIVRLEPDGSLPGGTVTCFSLPDTAYQRPVFRIASPPTPG